MNTHTEINDRPVIQLFIHNNNCYVYDYNKNIILRLSRSHYAEINELYTIGIKFYRELNKGTAEYKDIIILLNSGYFVDRTVEQLIHPYDGILEILLNRFTNDLVLQVTQDCNFQCRYCLYANDTKVERNHSKSMMDFSTAKKSIDYLYNHSMDANEVTIGYYGGEPFLNFDLIKRATEYANSIFQSKRIRYLITTNCSIINDEIIDFIITNNIQLTISYDGPYQDDHRKFRNNGSDTSNIVQQNIKK